MHKGQYLIILFMHNLNLYINFLDKKDARRISLRMN